MLLKTYNTELDEIITTFTYQNGRPLEIEYNVNVSFARNISNKYRKQLLDTGLVALKTASKTVVHKAAEARCEFIGNKIADAAAKSNDDNFVKIKP